jgi:hypothetical protein
MNKLFRFIYCFVNILYEYVYYIYAKQFIHCKRAYTCLTLIIHVINPDNQN